MAGDSADIADLIARCALRDRAAFGDLYSRTSAKLYGVALRILRDRSEADEALQEVYVKIWQRADRYVPGGYSPISWLVAIARKPLPRRPPGPQAAERRYRRGPRWWPTRVPIPNAPPSTAASGPASTAAWTQLDAEKADAVRGAISTALVTRNCRRANNVPLNTMRTWLRPQPVETARVPFGMSDDSDISGAGEDGFLVAEYALGLLPAAEHAALAARLRTDRALQPSCACGAPGCRAWMDSLPKPRRRPMPGKRSSAGCSPAAAPSGFWNSLALWRAASGVAAAVAVIAIGLNIATPRPDPNAFAAQLVAALSAQGSNVQVVALYNASTRADAADHAVGRCGARQGLSALGHRGQRGAQIDGP